MVLLDSWGMSKEYEESSGSTELAVDREAAPYESSSLLSWKVMLSYLVGERRQRVAIGSYMFLGGAHGRAYEYIIKRSEFLSSESCFHGKSASFVRDCQRTILLSFR